MGIIGCGNFMSAGHIRNLVASPEVEIVGLADPSTQSLERMKEKFPPLKAVAEYQDHRSLLDRSIPDAVEIATPHALHATHILDSLDAGCHVLVEKPLVVSIKDAEEVLAKRDMVGKVLLVSYQRRYEAGFQYIRQQISSGVLGDLKFVSATLSQGWLEFTRGAWRQDPTLSGGGMLMDTGSHLLDVILFSTGLSVDQVLAYSSNLGAPVDINTAVLIQFNGECVGNISIVGHAAKPVVESIHIFGDKGSLLFESGTDTNRCNAKARITQESYDTGTVEIPDLPAGSSPDQNFIDAILGRDNVKSPGEAGLEVLRLTEAIKESIRLGRQIPVASPNRVKSLG